MTENDRKYAIDRTLYLLAIDNIGKQYQLRK